jgi:hypothetical protein
MPQAFKWFSYTRASSISLHDCWFGKVIFPSIHLCKAYFSLAQTPRGSIPVISFFLGKNNRLLLWFRLLCMCFTPEAWSKAYFCLAQRSRGSSPSLVFLGKKITDYYCGFDYSLHVFHSRGVQGLFLLEKVYITEGRNNWELVDWIMYEGAAHTYIYGQGSRVGF